MAGVGRLKHGHKNLNAVHIGPMAGVAKLKRGPKTRMQFTWGSIAGTENERAELDYQLKRNSHHASIAMWDACNECGGGNLYDSFVMPKVPPSRRGCGACNISIIHLEHFSNRWDAKGASSPIWCFCVRAFGHVLNVC